MKRKHDAHESPETDPLRTKKQRLLIQRKALPIWPRKHDIQRALEEHDILVLSGETGSGKSTQIPQFLLESRWCSKCIAVTQPRRVAALSLARRVAEEMGSTLGSASPASKVGYSVRFDESVSPAMRIKYLTEGMLLQEMLRDMDLSRYSCIIVDEVHERSVNVDLLLGFLKMLSHSEKKRTTPLKIVVMSATANTTSLLEFFASSRTHDRQRPRDPVLMRIEGRQYPVLLHYLDRAADDVTQVALERIFAIHAKEPLPGDILVFLTGQEIIQALQKLVEEYATQMSKDLPKLLVLSLFAALPQVSQQRIFLPAPPRTRKVILSTNIAETSVTVPGVRFVIDTGKAKIKQYRNQLALDSLLVKPVSKSSADQRKGRAGREGPGQCFRLYTKATYEDLADNMLPEILRCDLSESVLKLKARGVRDVLKFPFLASPARDAIERALLQLLQLEAIQEDGHISAIGRKMARVPLPPVLARVLIEASQPMFECVPQVIDIVACLSVENIFRHIETEEEREQADGSRHQILQRSGDHLTLLAALQSYASEHADRKEWCHRTMINHRAMKAAMDVRKQLRAQCLQAKLVQSQQLEHVESVSSEDKVGAILKCFLRGAYPTNIARLCPDGSYKTLVGNQTVAIHPSSVLFGRKVEAILYNDFVFTNKAYARSVSTIQLNWLDDLLGEK